MATTGGANIAVDGLVFGYDTGYPLVSGSSDTYKFNKGEPTENLFLNPTFEGTSGTQTSAISDNWYFSGYTGSTGFNFYNNSTAPISLKFPNEGTIITTGPNDTSNRRFYCTKTLTPGSTYHVSAWIYVSTGGVSIAHFEYGGASLNGGYFNDVDTHPNYVAGEWFYWEDTYTVGADYSSGLIGAVISRTSNKLVGVQRFQIEQKSHPTPFTTGTRSVSGSLIDLTRTTDIHLSNVSFDSNAQMTFDGTDDIISLGNPDNLRNGEFTICFTYYPLTIQNAAYNGIVNGKTPNGRFCLFWFGTDQISLQYRDNSGLTLANGGVWRRTTASTSLSANKWHFIHITGNENNGEFRCGVNLVESPNTFNSQHVEPDANSWLLGKRGNATYDHSKIATFKIYNRVLSAKEILQNYNALKERFSL